MKSEISIPHLKTANVGTLFRVEEQILNHQIKIEGWFREQFQNQPILLATSVDLRNAGYKLAPVDTNLFPAGFNNLNPEFLPLCIQSFQTEMIRQYPKCQRILIVPESHTRNPFYFESLSTLYNIVSKAGFAVRIGTLLEIKSPKTIDLMSSGSLTLYPLTKEQNRLNCDGFYPDLIFLNNDLSEGVPALLKEIDQFITPLPTLGWAHRYKSQHFKHYRDVCITFSQAIGIDAWEICPLFEDCGEINFLEGGGESCLIDKTADLFEAIKHKYDEYQIEEPPFVVIKAERGTYGMAVMMVQSVEELKQLNRKQRQNMGRIKGGQIVDRVLIQEGVYTRESIGEQIAVAEPVIYMIGQYVVGGFYRVHTKKGPKENLNAPGMSFEPLAFEACCNQPDERLSSHASQNRFYAYSVIARLALLATIREYHSLVENSK
ncbi:MAG: glutamate--cysteine ligase [Gammaproteobacteria bacterium]